MRIEFEQTNVSKLIKDYLDEKESLSDLYHRFPNKNNYQKQAQEKIDEFEHREVLVSALTKQLSNLCLTQKQKEHLSLLKDNSTCTVTTGHQLNLLTGPLYFIYKVLHTIKICDVLNRDDKEFKYVPIYWMASEDHDFQEINHFYTYDNSYSYNTNQGGFVGDISSGDSLEALRQYLDTLPKNQYSEELKEIVLESYHEGENLAVATRNFVHKLLGKYGILILDGNDTDLKKLMIPYFEKELLNQPSKLIVEETNSSLGSYKNQAYARDINLFLLNNNKRERIEKINDSYVLSESLQSYSSDKIIKLLHDEPAIFSPNVILRPLYQEVILPNVAYVGGGGEIAYWLQLKGVFKEYNIAFPMLVLRNSMLLVPNAMKHKLSSMNLLSEKIFTPISQVKNDLVVANSPLFEEVETLRHDLGYKFEKLEDIASKTGNDFDKMVQAQKSKQLKGFDKLNERLIRSERKQQIEKMRKIDEIYDFAFPQGQWQERMINFSEFYVNNGSDLFDRIYEKIDPFSTAFKIVSLNSILK